MEQYKIGEVEMRFAEIVWRMEPVSLEELAEAVKEELGWKKSETEIMVKQLCEKGIFTLEKDLIKAKVSRSAFQRTERNVVSAHMAGENVRGKSFAGFRHSFWAPVAFEEDDVKSRIQNIMKYRKTAVALAVCAVVVCLLAVGVFVTKSEEREGTAQGQKIGKAGKAVLEDIIVKGEKPESKIKGDGGMAQYFAWINRIRNGMLDNFQTVSVGDLGISDRFISSDLWRGNMGYAFLDLDSDGVYELLLGGNIKPDYGDPELNPIFGIYGLQDGQVVAVALCEDANDTIYLCANGAIAKETKKISEESDVYQEQYLYYRYQDLSLQLMEMLTCETSKNPMEAWAYCEGEAGEAVTVKPSKAWEIQKKYEPENVLFQILVKKEKLQKAREDEALRVVYPNPEKLAFSDLNGLLFSARNKELIIRPDGTFEGRYHFGRGGMMGYHFNSTAEECYFSGKISTIRKTGDYAYTMKCMEIQAEGTPGEERIIGDTLVTTFGLEDIFPEMRDVDLAKEEFRLYLPGMRESELPDGYEYWSLDCLEYGVLTSYVLVLAEEAYEVNSLEDAVYEIARSEYTMEPVTIPEEVLSEEEIADLRKETPVKENFSFSDLKGEAFVNFRVGSSTFLEVAEDGTFTVTERSNEGISSEWFSVAPKGIVNEVVLKGEFYDLKRVGPYHYTIKCKSLKKEPAGKERLEEGYRFVTVEGEIPGFEKYDKFELYLPGYRITELPEGYFKWSDWDEKKDGILYSYYLYNVGTETMFQP